MWSTLLVPQHVRAWGPDDYLVVTGTVSDDLEGGLVLAFSVCSARKEINVVGK